MSRLLPRRMEVAGTQGVVLALVVTVFCLFVAVNAFLPVPPPTPLDADGTAVVPGRPGAAGGTTLYVRDGTDLAFLEEQALADRCRVGDDGEFDASAMPLDERDLADGTRVEGVAVADSGGRGATVRCEDLTTPVWVGVDTSDRLMVGLFAAFFVPASLVAAVVFRVVGRAAGRSPE